MKLLSTLVVTLAVATMFALGVWQLDRARWKENLLSRYEAAMDRPAVDYPTGEAVENPPYFRRSSVDCEEVTGWNHRAGANRDGQSGFVHIADCQRGAARFAIETGWSREPEAGTGWTGGEVSGIISPDGRYGLRLVADEGLGGLEPSAPPSPDSIRNNHRSYAFQWFAFAFIASVIYLLALRKKRREERNA